jgi:hypothetical protein
MDLKLLSFGGKHRHEPMSLVVKWTPLVCKRVVSITIGSRPDRRISVAGVPCQHEHCKVGPSRQRRILPKRQSSNVSIGADEAAEESG